MSDGAREVVGRTLKQLSGLGWSTNLLKAAADVVLVDLEVRDYAIVKLPEPDEPTSINWDFERHIAGWDVDAGSGRIEVRVDIFRQVQLEGAEYSSAEIRALVPALLAAAKKADQ